MTQQAKKRTPRSPAGARKYGTVTWKDFAGAAHDIVVSTLEDYDDVFKRLLNGQPAKTSISTRSLLFGNWLLINAVGVVNADQDSYPTVDDLHLLSAFDEELIYLYVCMAQAVWHTLPPSMYQRFMGLAIDAIFDTLEAIWDKVNGGANTDRIVDDFDEKRKERERLYDKCPPRIKDRYYRKGTLSGEAGVLIAKALFDTDHSKDAQDFLFAFRFSDPLVIRDVNVQKFIAGPGIWTARQSEKR